MAYLRGLFLEGIWASMPIFDDLGRSLRFRSPRRKKKKKKKKKRRKRKKNKKK